MAGYQVLDEVPSSSDPKKVYQIRRGGDGVLYCASREGRVCQGWLSNKNALRRTRSEHLPAACRHLKEYVARTGASYGPQYGFPTAAPAPAKAQVPAVAAQSAPKNWRDLLLQERRAAESRGIVTPAAALAEFEREVGRFANLDVEEPSAVSVRYGGRRALDVD